MSKPFDTVEKLDPHAFFPSKFAVRQFSGSKRDLEVADCPQPYVGTRRILVIATDERYRKMENGTLFSTGNHAIEALVPMNHLHQAGFTFVVASVSGDPVKFELWSMPKKNQAITGLHKTFLDQKSTGSF